MRLSAITLFALLELFMLSEVCAQVPSDLCELGDTTKLFLAQDGTKYSTKLPKGTTVILKAKHGKRWMVETAVGKLGFIKEKWLKKTCTFTKPAPSVPKKTAPPAPTQPVSISESAAALDVTRAVAESPQAGTAELLETQAEVLEKARNVRKQSQAIQCEESNSSESFRVAVYDLELLNIPDGMGRIVSNTVLDEVRKLEGVSAIGMDEIREMVNFEAERQAMGCDSDQACLAEIAGALGVDEIITGSLSEEADGRMFLMRRIDQRRADVVQTVNQPLEIGNGEEFLLAVGPGIEKLYPNRKNRPGTERGVPDKAFLRLNPPPIEAGFTWATMAAATVGLALGGTFAYLSHQQKQLYSGSTAEDSEWVPGAELRDIQNTGNQYNLISNIGIVGGATFTLSAIIMSFFTDWEGIADEED